MIHQTVTITYPSLPTFVIPTSDSPDRDHYLSFSSYVCCPHQWFTRPWPLPTLLFLRLSSPPAIHQTVTITYPSLPTFVVPTRDSTDHDHYLPFSSYVCRPHQGFTRPWPLPTLLFLRLSSPPAVSEVPLPALPGLPSSRDSPDRDYFLPFSSSICHYHQGFTRPWPLSTLLFLRLSSPPGIHQTVTITYPSLPTFVVPTMDSPDRDYYLPFSSYVYRPHQQFQKFHSQHFPAFRLLGIHQTVTITYPSLPTFVVPTSSFRSSTPSTSRPSVF